MAYRTNYTDLLKEMQGGASKEASPSMPEAMQVLKAFQSDHKLYQQLVQQETNTDSRSTAVSAQTTPYAALLDEEKARQRREVQREAAKQRAREESQKRTGQSFLETLMGVSKSIADTVERQNALKKKYSYTADNIGQYRSRAIELAKKDALTEEERFEARALQRAMESWIRNENSLQKQLSGDRDVQTINDYSALSQALHVKDSGLRAAGAGFLSAFPGAQAVVRNGMTNAAMEYSDDVREVLERDLFQDAQQTAPAAYGAGRVAGDLAVLGATGMGAGAATESLAAAAKGSKLAELAVKGLRSGLTFGAKAGLQSAGEQDWSDAGTAAKNVAKDTGISAAAGAVGGIASEITGTAVGTVLAKKNLMTPFMEFVRQTASGTAFGSGMIGTEYALTPKDERPTNRELAQEFGTAFLFAVISGAIGTAQTTKAERAKLDRAVTEVRQELSRMSEGLMTPEEAQEAAARILAYTDAQRTAISQHYYPGQQEYIDSVRDALDAVDELAVRFAGTASTMRPQGNLLTGETGTAAGGLVPRAAQALPETQVPDTQTISQGARQAVTEAVTETPGEKHQREERQRYEAAETKPAPAETRITPEDKRAEVLKSLQSMDGVDAIMYLSEQSGEIRDLKTEAIRAVRGAEAAEWERLENTINNAAAAGDPEAIRDKIITDLGGTVNVTEGNRVSDGEGRRDAGAGAGVEAGAVRPEERAVRADAGETGNGGQTARGVPQEVWTSVREQGFRTGTEDKTIRLRPEASWTDAMRERAERAAGMDMNLRYADGDLRVTGRDGRTRSVQGIVEDSSILVRSDSRIYRPEQTADHEITHVVIRNDPELLHEAKTRLGKTFGDDEIRDMLLRYMDLYGFAYGEVTEGMTEDEIEALMDQYLEEIVCDAAGGISRQRLPGRGAAKYTEDVRALIEERRGMGYGAGGMPGEARYMYAGERAQTANVGTLSEAEQRLDAGEDSEAVRKETGWFRGMDGKWRFEISDKDMKLYPMGDARFRADHPEYVRYQSLMEKLLYGNLTGEEIAELRELDQTWGREQPRLSYAVNNGNATLDMILDHPALFEAYPQLRDVKVLIADQAAGAGAFYNEKHNQIVISSEHWNNDKKCIETLAHEIQHAVQSIEGFSGGANFEYWASEKRSRAEDAEFRTGELESELQKIQEFVSMLERNGWDSDSEAYRTASARVQELQEELERTQRMLEDYRESLSVDLYYRTAGEIEARDTAARRGMTVEERKNTRPDVDREDVVFAGNAGESFSIARTRDMDWEDQVRGYFSKDGSIRSSDYLYIGESGDFFAEQGIQSAPLTLPGSVINKATRVKKGSRSGHELTQKNISDIKNNIENAPAVILDTERNSLIYLTDDTDRNGNPIIAVFTLNQELYGENTHRAASIYGRENVESWIQNLIEKDGTRFYIQNKNKFDKIAGVQTDITPKLLAKSKLVDESVSQYPDESKPQNLTLQEQLERGPVRDETPLVPLNEQLHRNDAKSIEEPRYSISDEESLAEVDTKTLRRNVKKDEARVETLQELFRERAMPADLLQEMKDIQARLEQERAELKTRNAKTQKERKEARERAEKREKPTQARRDLLDAAMEQFSVDGRADGRQMLGSYFDKWFAAGQVDEAEKQTAFDRLMDAGAIRLPADPVAEEVRSNIAGTRIYVPEDVKAEFGDRESWNRFRQQAMGQGVYLVNDPTTAYHIDNLYQELQGSFGHGVFRQDTDTTEMLKDIVDMAREGRAESVSLYEMMKRTEKAEGWTVDDQIDEMYQRFSQAVDKAMYAAGIETTEKAKVAEVRQQYRESGERMRQRQQESREREYKRRREILQRQAEQKQIRELQQKTLRSLQWLSRNRNKAPEELRGQFDEVLGDLDIYAASAANEMRWSDKHQATWRDLADMYAAAKESDPNFLPSKELQKIWDRVNLRKVGEMDVDALSDLYRAATALRTEFYNRNNVLADEEHRLFSELYQDATEEIRASGGKGRLGKFFNDEMLTPMNMLEAIGGWKRDGQWYSMAKQLQAGERARKGYAVEAKAMLDEFTRTHEDWIRKADGQGKDAIWYEAEVSPLLELNMGGKPMLGEPVTVYMTPMQKVHLYLESKNYQNLRHMTGGRTFVNKELYAKGKAAEALAQGTTIRLAPESVQRLVSDLTEEERELAGLLEKYYNQYASGRINQVSNVLLGYDKAMTSNYAPIFTDANYNKSTAGIFDMTAEGVGHMKTREQYSAAPSYNISAIDAFERHVDQTSRYVGLAIPIRNMETLMNWRTRDGSMKKTLSETWGKEGVDYVTNLMTELQSPTADKTGVLERAGNKLVSNYISAVFGFNPGIVFKQNASYISAAATLGYDTMPAPWQLGRADEDLILKYTPELAYRKLGYATPEVAELKKNPSKLDTNPVLKFLLRGGAITWMDATTVKNLWPWAENYVRKYHPELELGTQEQIDAGQSPFYRKVAEVFNEAVNVTQPMYDVMNRAPIMNQKSAMTRTLTLFKTVPLQEYNTMRKYAAEAKGGDGRAKAKAAGAVGSVILSTMALETVAALAALIKNGMKYYRDDEGELTAESFAKEFGTAVLGDLTGIIPGGSFLFEQIAHKLGWSDYASDFSIVGSEQVNDLVNACESIAARFEKTVEDLGNLAQSGGSLEEYLRRNGGDIAGDVHDFAVMLAQYAAGLPVANIEKYLGGLVETVLPGFRAKVDALTDTTTKTDLSGMHGEELASRTGMLFSVRGMDIDDGTAAELARLYETGDKTVIPSDTPKSFDGTDGEKITLTTTQRQEYDNTYSRAVSGNLDRLVESDPYIDADDKERAKLISKLYSYAGQLAKADVIDYQPDKWVLTAQEAMAGGVELADYLAVKALAGTKQVEMVEFIDGMDLSPTQKGKLLYYTVGTDAKQKLMDDEVSGGGTWGDAYDAAAADIRKNARANAPAVGVNRRRARPAPEDVPGFDPYDGRGYYPGLRLPG